MPFFIFKNPNNRLEGASEDFLISCPRCKKNLEEGDLISRLNVCIHCGFHFRQRARQRIYYLCDRGIFFETDANMTSENILNFFDYDNKL